MSLAFIKKIPPPIIVAAQFAQVLFFVFLFLVSIDLLGTSFKMSGSGLAARFMQATSNPFIGLIIGIVTTSIIQSSSSTTSIIVAMVGAGMLNLQNAIPMIMGANIGTTVTCTIVSFGYIGRKVEFERSFRASIVHDLFNICATIVLFPLEMLTGIIFKSAQFMVGVFQGVGGFDLVSPIKIILAPITHIVLKIVPNHYLLLILALIIMFYSMSRIVKNMKGIVMEKIENILNKYLFRNILASMLFGCFFTALVQSSSIATSIVVPLVGAGLLSIEQIFPYTLGANVGTTITAILAALSVGTGPAMSVAFAHLLFNIFGILLIFPVRRIPIGLAKKIAAFVSVSKKNFFIFLIFFLMLHFVPIMFAIFF
ncbi:Na/Pi symporter [Candidatus Latescibacterota bacterium]